MPDTSSNPQPQARFYYGWVIVVVVALAGFTQSAETYPVLGVFLKPMTDEFGWSRSVFAGAMSIGTILGGFLALGIGPLVDRYGPRWILTFAFIILGATLALLGGITTLWQYYALQIIGRVMTMGVIAMAMQVIIPKWFVAKRGRTVALVPKYRRFLQKFASGTPSSSPTPGGSAELDRSAHIETKRLNSAETNSTYFRGCSSTAPKGEKTLKRQKRFSNWGMWKATISKTQTHD